MSRLFVAVDLPEEVKRALGALRADIPGARWVRASQLHVTLRFLGDTPEAAAASLAAALGSIRRPPFRLRLAGPGCFPGERRPRVLWVGAAPEEPLAALAAEVEAAARSSGFPPEERAFSPHVTLARFPSPPPGRELAHFLERHRTFATPDFPVDEFVLYQSELRPDGPVYRRAAAIPLAGGAALP